MFKNDDHVLEYVDDYLHELLEVADANYLLQHCGSCRICKVALEEAQKRFAALESVPSCEASGALVQAALARIERHGQQRNRWQARFRRVLLPAMAAAVIGIAVLQFYFSNLRASPSDLKILGQSELLAGSHGSLRVHLVNHDTGDPLADIPVDVELLDKPAARTIPLASFITDGQGTGDLRFELPDWPDGAYDLRVVAHPRGGDEILQERVKLSRSWKLMLTTDKPVYQPGQTIHLRSLSLRRPDLHPVASQEITFLVTDPKGNVIFKRADLTSPFGIASIDCPLADEILEGAYTITCKLGNTDSKLTVDVKKYVLPKFKIGIEMDKPFCQPGEKIQGKVRAEYFFGKPVAGAAVGIDLLTTDVAVHVHRTLSLTTDASGEAAYSFIVPERLIGREQDSGDARIKLQVGVRDTSGQKETKMVGTTITNRPLRIDVIPEAGQLITGVANTIYLYTSYADGRPARTKIAIGGMAKELSTNDLGIASFQSTPQVNQRAALPLTVRATDAQGRVGRYSGSLSLSQARGDFLVRTDKAVYNGGDTVRLSVVGAGVEPVFIDIVKDGQTVLTEAVEPGGQNQNQFDLPPDLFGTVGLCAYRFGSAGLPVRKTRILYIRPARQLNIKTTLDRDEYRPAAQAHLRIALTDDRGQVLPGALSLMGIDEAVYSVLDQAPGMERTFYLLEQQLLRPVYAIYPWSPDLHTSAPAAEVDEFEQALFAKTVREVQAVRIKGDDPLPLTGSPLFSTSLPAKLSQASAARALGLHYVNTAWLIAGGFLLVMGLVAVVALYPAEVVKAIKGLVFAVLIGVLPFLAFLAFINLGTNANVTFTSGGNAVNSSVSMMPMAPPDSTRMNLGADKILGADEMKSAGQPPKLGPTQQETTAAPIRVREWFPETLLWRPEVITDDQGIANVDVELADSITTWRLMVSAVAADGRLGAFQAPLRVFQPFFVDLNLPVALTRGDEVGIPVVVYNYLDKPQTVELLVEKAGWFESLEPASQRLELPAGAVRSLNYRIRVTKIGRHQFQVHAQGSGVADAIKREIEVVPDGRRVEQVVNGVLQGPAAIDLSVPQDAIEGSPRALLKFYPSSLSQLVEGLDAIFRQPSGCFEQTSSTTYPNVLALDYLRRTKKSVPQVEAKARQYIHLGYQRLLGFEVAGAGFDWFGRPPANRVLTAYGLMEFEDMARVHDVDPRLVDRTRAWLIGQRDSDGSWSPEGHRLHDDPTGGQRGEEMARLSTTAYIAWAVFRGMPRSNEARRTERFISRHEPSEISDPYVLAVIANALLAIDPSSGRADPYLERLESLRRSSADGKQIWWEQPESAATGFYSSGRCGAIETTALSALAFMTAQTNPGSVRGALNWLIAQKDASGTWHSTQATVLALKALLAGTEMAETQRRIEVRWDNDEPREIVVSADQADVLQQIDLSSGLTPGQHWLSIVEKDDSATVYQVAFRYHVPGTADKAKPDPIAIDEDYDRNELTIGDTVTAHATVRNQMQQTAPMLLVDLPIPAGFVPVSDDFQDMVAAGTIAKFQVQARSVLVYLRGLESMKTLKLSYRLRATMPVKVAVPPARVYEYYNRDRSGASRGSRFTVNKA
jgi:hypothetical protein